MTTSVLPQADAPAKLSVQHSPEHRKRMGQLASVAEPLQPRENENDRAYACFLLWCMSTTDERSKRLIASAMGMGDANVRMWASKFAWDRRQVMVADAEWEALRAYRLLMDLQAGSAQMIALRLAMDVVLDRAGFASLRHQIAAERQGEGTQGADPAVQPDPPAPAPPCGKPVSPAFKTPLSDQELTTLNPQAYMQKLRNRMLEDHLRPEDMRKQVLLIDAVLGLIAKKVQSGELRVQVSDIPQLLKARALLTGLPTEQVAMAAQVQVQHTHEVIVESARMADARKRGGAAMLAAMQLEVGELATILQAVPRATVLDVVPHPTDNEDSE